jgi:hypothetical protein
MYCLSTFLQFKGIFIKGLCEKITSKDDILRLQPVLVFWQQSSNGIEIEVVYYDVGSISNLMVNEDKYLERANALAVV